MNKSVENLKWLMNFLVWKKYFGTLRIAHLANWLSHELKAATRWPVATAANTSAIDVAKQLMVMTISGLFLNSQNPSFCVGWFLFEHANICQLYAKVILLFIDWRDGACDLYPPQMIQEWEERMNARQVLGQVQAQLFVGQGQGQLCPNCRQFNAKVSKD